MHFQQGVVVLAQSQYMDSSFDAGVHSSVWHQSETGTRSVRSSHPDPHNRSHPSFACLSARGRYFSHFLYQKEKRARTDCFSTKTETQFVWLACRAWLILFILLRNQRVCSWFWRKCWEMDRSNAASLGNSSLARVSAKRTTVWMQFGKSSTETSKLSRNCL